MVGSGIAVIGATTTWYRTIARGRDIPSSLGTVHVRGAEHSFSAGDLGSPLPAIGLLCLMLAVLAFLVGPRARTLLVALVTAGAAAILILSFVVRAPSPGNGTRQGGPGRIVTPVGGAIALGMSLVALPLAPEVRRARIPESGPPAEP